MSKTSKASRARRATVPAKSNSQVPKARKAPTSEKPVSQAAEFRRKSIVAAAVKCFARSGFEGASIAAIAAEAGITVPTVYNYFGSKMALFGAIIEGIVADQPRLFEVYLPKGMSFRQRLELLQAHQFGWAEERREAFVFLMRLGSVPSDVQESTTQAHVERLSAWITEHSEGEELKVDIETMARIWEAIGSLYFKRWVEAGGEQGALVSKASEVVSVVMDGVVGEPDS